jgi:hypothetical protein
MPMTCGHLHVFHSRMSHWVMLDSVNNSGTSLTIQCTSHGNLKSLCSMVATTQ